MLGLPITMLCDPAGEKGIKDCWLAVYLLHGLQELFPQNDIILHVPSILLDAISRSDFMVNFHWFKYLILLCDISSETYTCFNGKKINITSEKNNKRNN